MQELHGYTPGTVTPTTDLVLRHKHPEDRDYVAATIDAIVSNRGALSSRHRIIDTAGGVHWVLIIGDRLTDGNGKVIGTSGLYLDVTPVELAREAEARRRESLVSARVAEITANRARIEQVKGMMMLIYDINEEVAFGVLRWLSQTHNVKLRQLAEQLLVDLQATVNQTLDQSRFDRVLLTAHERLAVGDHAGDGTHSHEPM
ncbi:antitermination regulator [Mycolicibacterium setense]|nr:antitermination regulator [Mycolicibacterium setense]